MPQPEGHTLSTVKRSPKWDYRLSLQMTLGEVFRLTRAPSLWPLQFIEKVNIQSLQCNQDTCCPSSDVLPCPLGTQKQYTKAENAQELATS